jgi:hypothetical protein
LAAPRWFLRQDTDLSSWRIARSSIRAEPSERQGTAPLSIMIDDTDKQLKDWVTSVLGATEVALTPPAPAPAGSGVSLYLMALAPVPPARSIRRAPLQVMLRYLVTTWAEEPEAAHRLLSELVFAALGNPAFEVELEPLPATTWEAFGTAIRPAFVLNVPLRVEQPEPPYKPVLVPLVMQSAPLLSLVGVVLGPHDTPLAGARVELPSQSLAVYTDRKGRFRFGTVPGEPPTKQLIVRARGHVETVTVTMPPNEGEPVVIHIDLFELKEG